MIPVVIPLSELLAHVKLFSKVTSDWPLKFPCKSENDPTLLSLRRIALESGSEYVEISSVLKLLSVPFRSISAADAA